MGTAARPVAGYISRKLELSKPLHSEVVSRHSKQRLAATCKAASYTMAP